MRNRRLPTSWCTALALLLWPAIASADIVVGNAPLPRADKIQYPNGFNAVDVTASNPPFDFNKDFEDPNGKFSYDFASKGLNIKNTEVNLAIKHVWFRMDYTPGEKLPPVGPNGEFFPNQWPSLGVPAGFHSAVTAASEYGGAGAAMDNFIEMKWDIVFQPSNETIFLNFPALNGDYGGIHSVRVETICESLLNVPELDPGSTASALTLLLGGVLTLTGRRLRRTSRGPADRPVD